jgi:hypothetical protein
VMLKPGQCQEINCVGDLRHINNDYKCNGTVIAKVVCGEENDSGSSGYGSASGYSSNRLCCNQNGGTSGSGTSGAALGGTSANIKTEPLDIPKIDECGRGGETLVFFSTQQCCEGLRSIFIKKDGDPVELCIKNGGQNEGQPCDDDEDCSAGLLCSYHDSVCGKSR